MFKVKTIIKIVFKFLRTYRLKLTINFFCLIALIYQFNDLLIEYLSEETVTEEIQFDSLPAITLCLPLNLFAMPYL